VKRGGADKLLIARYKANEKWNGKTMQAVSLETGREVVDLVIEIQKNGGASAVSFNMCDEDVEYVMRKDYVATASDGSSKRPDESRPHPRSYGTFPRKIGHYSIERSLIPLPLAIRSCSGLPADILGLRDRGYVREGYVADLVLFDPASFRDKATYADPHQCSTGVDWLWVNGQAAIAEGQATGTLAGRAIRRLP
jgi:N-acyl-D-aspartate/D-glutamate deacylase